MTTGAWDAQDDRDRPLLALLEVEPSLAGDIRSALDLWLPSSELTVLAHAEDAALDTVTAVIVGPESAGGAAVAALRRLRASGFAGRVLLLAEGDAATTEDDAQTLRTLAGAVAATAAGPAQWFEALSPPVEGGGEPGRRVAEPAAVRQLDAELQRTRRRLAVAELALGLPHAMNNPLAALLAETQLLELEELDEELHASAVRMVELVRRLIGLVRQLEAARAADRRP